MPDPVHNRHTVRLPGYDYAQAGGYFVTLITWHRENSLCAIQGEQVVLSGIGTVAQAEWLRLEKRFPYLAVDEFVIMPNHVHGILILRSADGVRARQDNTGRDHERFASPLQPVPGSAQPKGTGCQTLGAIVGAYKSSVSKRAHYILDNPGIPIWQRNYYEHVIRSENELHKIREYIRDNPLQWALDEESPQKGKP